MKRLLRVSRKEQEIRTVLNKVTLAKAWRVAWMETS